MKIAVYSICKNEEKHVARWLESVRDADAIFVLDTGSEDSTKELLEQEPKVSLHTANFVPFRFDIARNMIANQVPEDFDICLFLDFDEVLEAGWRQKLEAIQDPYDALWFRMIFSRDAAGNPDQVYNRLMAHRPHSYVWMYPIHEVLVPQQLGATELSTDITVEHLPDIDKPRSDYLDMLKAAVEEMPQDARMRQYLGREYMYREEWASAIIQFDTHVLMKDSRICIGESYRYLSRCHEALNHIDEAEHSLMKAVVHAYDQREPYAELSSFHQRQQNIERCLSYALHCSSIPESSNYVIRARHYYREWPHHMAAWCYNQLGALDLAQKHIRYALNLAPDHPQVIADYISLTGEMPLSLMNKINQGELSISYESRSSGNQPQAVSETEQEQAEEVSQGLSSVESPLFAGRATGETS